MPIEPPDSNQSRREGRARACEGLLASRFGQRASQAGEKALQQLRAEQTAADMAQSRAARTTVPVQPSVVEWIACWFRDGMRRLLPVPGQNAPWRWAVGVSGLFFIFTLFSYSAYLWLKPSPVVALAVLGVRGSGTMVERSDRQITAMTGMLILPNDIIRTAKHSQATLHFRQSATRLELAESTEFHLGSIDQQWQCEVRRGTVVAEVELPSPQKAMVFITPQAEAEVLGTHFILAVKRFSTWLEVIEGQVRLRRPADGVATLVGPRQYAVAANGLELSARFDNQRWQTPYSIQRPPKGAS